MTDNNSEKEILALTIKLNAVISELQEKEDGFLDSAWLDRIYSLNKQLQEKMAIGFNRSKSCE